MKNDDDDDDTQNLFHTSSQTENMQNKSFSKCWCSSCEKRNQLQTSSTTFETFSQTGSSWSGRYQVVNQENMYLQVLLWVFQYR